MLNERSINGSKTKLAGMAELIQSESMHHYVCSDPTRLRILYLFKKHTDLCPSDLHGILDLSMSAISHQLKSLEQIGIVYHVKMGKKMCYGLTKEGKKFIKKYINL